VAWLSTSGGGSDGVGRPDLEKPRQAGGESVRARESARVFLTVSNSRLKFLVPRGGSQHEHHPADVLPGREGCANRR
jgi:hypothetical protein